MSPKDSDRANQENAQTAFERFSSIRDGSDWGSAFFRAFGRDDVALQRMTDQLDRIGLSRSERIRADFADIFSNVLWVATRKPVGLAAQTNRSLPQVTQNRLQGEAFVARELPEIKKVQTNVVQEVTAKTQSGVKTRLDILGTNSSGQIVGTEIKSSATAPLTRNQTAAFPEIAKTGAHVVGKGKWPYVGGTYIAPHVVPIRRPPK